MLFKFQTTIIQYNNQPTMMNGYSMVSLVVVVGGVVGVVGVVLFSIVGWLNGDLNWSSIIVRHQTQLHLLHDLTHHLLLHQLL